MPFNLVFAAKLESRCDNFSRIAYINRIRYILVEIFAGVPRKTVAEIIHRNLIRYDPLHKCAYIMRGFSFLVALSALNLSAGAIELHVTLSI